MAGYRGTVQVELQQMAEQLQRLIDDPHLLPCHRARMLDLLAHVAEAQRALWRVRHSRARPRS